METHVVTMQLLRFIARAVGNGNGCVDLGSRGESYLLVAIPTCVGRRKEAVTYFQEQWIAHDVFDKCGGLDCKPGHNPGLASEDTPFPEIVEMRSDITRDLGECILVDQIAYYNAPIHGEQVYNLADRSCSGFDGVEVKLVHHDRLEDQYDGRTDGERSEGPGPIYLLVLLILE